MASVGFFSQIPPPLPSEFVPVGDRQFWAPPHQKFREKTLEREKTKTKTKKQKQKTKQNKNKKQKHKQKTKNKKQKKQNKTKKKKKNTRLFSARLRLKHFFYC